MENLTERQQKYLDFLLADFGATKAEIARRSNLQRVVLAAYVAVFVFVGKELIFHPLTAPLIVGFWISGALSFQFYTREGLEIERLGTIIRKRIAPAANRILEVQVPDLLPSETNAVLPQIDRVTHRYNLQFIWTIYFLVPLIITIFYLSQDWSRLSKLLDFNTRGPYMGFSSILSGSWTFVLLKRHAWPWKNNH